MTVSVFQHGLDVRVLIQVLPDEMTRGPFPAGLMAGDLYGYQPAQTVCDPVGIVLCVCMCMCVTIGVGLDVL